MAHVLKLLGCGLEIDPADLLGGYFRAAQAGSLEQLPLDGRAADGPDNLHLPLGVAFLQSGQLAEAIDHLRQVSPSGPEAVGAEAALAVAYQEHGELSAALDAMKAVLRADGQKAPLLFAAGLCCEKLGRSSAAGEYYRQATEADPWFAPSIQRLAAVDVLTAELDDAIDQYRHLARVNPGQQWIRSSLGHLYYLNGLYAQAAEEFQTAIVMGPENWSMNDEEVEALVAAGALREAIDRLGMLVSEQGQFADLYVRLGDLHAQLGDDDAAMSSYLRALDIQPAYLEAMVKVGTEHLVYNRLEQAAEAFHRAAELNNELLFNYVGMGVSQLADGRGADALNSFELAAAVEPNTTLLLTETVRLQLRAAERDPHEQTAPGAASCLFVAGMGCDDDLLERQILRHEREVDRCGGSAELRYRYGVLLRYVGRIEDAQRQFAEAVALNRHYVEAVIALALAMRQTGRVGEAAVTFRKALDIDEAAIGLHYRLGLLYSDGPALQEVFEELGRAYGEAEGFARTKADLAMLLKNMGLMDSAAVTWRSLCSMDRGNP